MKCVSGKRSYTSMELAEEALINAHVIFHYRQGEGPKGVYSCEDCGYFHLTSRGEMNTKLAEMLKNGEIQRMRNSRDWEGKLKR